MSSESSAPKLLLDWLGGIAAFLTVAVYGVLVINAKFNFLPVNILNILAVAKTWAPLIVVAITGLEFTSGKSFIAKLIFLILCAVVVLSMFFPETWENVVGVVKK